MVNKARKVRKVNGAKRIPWTKAHEKELRGHSRNKTPVEKIARAMKRTAGALRQKAFSMGLPLGHYR
jgi:hypothetical protein